jgi:hypothetical protein
MNNILIMLKDYDTEKLHLDFMLKILEKNHLLLSTNFRLKRPLMSTVDIQHWYDERVRIAGSIAIQMRGIAQGNLASMREEIKIAQKVVKPYLTNLRKKKKTDVETLIDGFLREIKKDTLVRGAFTKIALMPYIEKLEKASNEHYKFHKKRNTEAAAKQSGDRNKAINKEAQAALRSLFNQIALGHISYPELNYVPLITHVNVDLTRFTNIIKTRDTYNKKRAQKAKEEKEAALASKMESEMYLKPPASEEENQN